MFNKKYYEVLEIHLENLNDAIYLLSEEVKSIREEVDYLLEVLDND
jgi:hypothetical protein